MNSAQTTFPFDLKAQTSTVQQASSASGAETRRRAQPPERWSFRVELPLVREGMRHVNGAPSAFSASAIGFTPSAG